MAKATIDYLRKLINEEIAKLQEASAPINSEEIYYNTLSALQFFSRDGQDISLGEADEEIRFLVSRASSPDGDIISKFAESLTSGKRTGFLSPYSKNELAAMNLYLVDGLNAGFAIKTDGDIVSVHNNSNRGGLSGIFMRRAIEEGGNKLDHFDGFLSGLYRKHGFNHVYEVYSWNEIYAPKEWEFSTIDILNPSRSIYAQALMDIDPGVDKENATAVLPNEEVGLKAESGIELEVNPSLKFNEYSHGRPDVIFRKL